MHSSLPVLYSFRRCPYAMRARMAISVSRTTVELREVVLREMPASLMVCSPKGTVPVLMLPDGRVLEASRDIIDWALALHDPEQWLPDDSEKLAVTNSLIDENDFSFKEQLDRYKYAERYPEHPTEYYRAAGENFLGKLEQRLAQHAFLLCEHITVADISIFPFIRQFAHVDKAWFDGAPYPGLQRWLQGHMGSGLFAGVMGKYPQWQEGDEMTLFPDDGQE
ncbi:MAG: glutathione S-transferase [Gammaproteobacteria bacterium]|nr:glutathione S-transferase [Gammaproteobacteria bacterium]